MNQKAQACVSADFIDRSIKRTWREVLRPTRQWSLYMEPYGQATREHPGVYPLTSAGLGAGLEPDPPTSAIWVGLTAPLYPGRQEQPETTSVPFDPAGHGTGMQVGNSAALVLKEPLERQYKCPR